MAVGMFCFIGAFSDLPEWPPPPGHGKRRGVTKSPHRAKRRNRKKP